MYFAIKNTSQSSLNITLHQRICQRKDRCEKYAPRSDSFIVRYEHFFERNSRSPLSQMRDRFINIFWLRNLGGKGLNNVETIAD